MHAIKEATDRKIKDLNDERTRAMNEQREILKNQHGVEVANLRKEQERIVAERNQKLQEYQQMQASLNQQIQSAHQQIQALQNRPRTYSLPDTFHVH